MNAILLQAAAPQGSGWLPNLLVFGAVLLVFYFFMIRPQQKKAQDQKSFRENLKKGMNVVTIGGLHGKIVEVETDAVWLEVDRGTRLKFNKTAIAVEADSNASAKV